MRIPKIKYPHIALHAADNVLRCVGAFVLLAYFLNLHLFLASCSMAFLGVLWYLLYFGEISYRTRRMERTAYR